ncbi:MAG: nucleoside 2-deoxyribosyltransferase [Alphaproteobacteria bacterium]|nr:nucleoside 2-deoxyribosyltransferase [Alphaproteobacteria bacterium]
MRVYLAGPDVFHPDALALGQRKKDICADFGLTGVFPLDNDLDLQRLPPHAQGMAIFHANTKLMDGCDTAIANMTPFRGPSCDPGTAYEIGYMRGMGKLVLAYSNTATLFTDRSTGLDSLMVESFGMVDNLMLDGAVVTSGFDILTQDADDPFTDLTAFTDCVRRLASPKP